MLGGERVNGGLYNKVPNTFPEEESLEWRDGRKTNLQRRYTSYILHNGRKTSLEEFAIYF